MIGEGGTRVRWKMTEQTGDYLGKLIGEFLACYLVTLRVLDELMPFIKAHGYRAYKRKVRRRKKRKQQKGQSDAKSI